MNCRTSMLADFKFALLSLYLLISWMNYFDKLRQRPAVNVAKYTTKIKFKQIHKCILTWVALVQVSPPMHPYAGHQSAISLFLLLLGPATSWPIVDNDEACHPTAIDFWTAAWPAPAEASFVSFGILRLDMIGLRCFDHCCATVASHWNLILICRYLQ